MFVDVFKEVLVVNVDGLLEGNNWCYSEFIKVVMSGKVERVRFFKDGFAL